MSKPSIQRVDRTRLRAARERADPPYSGQPGTTVQLHVCAGTTTAGMFGVIATKPMSRIGEFGPEKTSLTAVVTEPVVPSYGCGRAGPAGAPGTVMGPSGRAAGKYVAARLAPWAVKVSDKADAACQGRYRFDEI